MGVVFAPYLKRAAERISDDAGPTNEREDEHSGPSTWTVAVGAAVAGVAAALAARRLKHILAAEERREVSETGDESTGRLRRVGMGWIRR